MKLIRTLEDHQEYQIHKKIQSEFGINIVPLLFDSKFCGHVITKNKFPYLPNHHIIWIQPGYERFYTKETIQHIIGVEEFSESDMSRGSILDVKHFHFSKKFFDIP